MITLSDRLSVFFAGTVHLKHSYLPQTGINWFYSVFSSSITSLLIQVKLLGWYYTICLCAEQISFCLYMCCIGFWYTNFGISLPYNFSESIQNRIVGRYWYSLWMIMNIDQSHIAWSTLPTYMHMCLIVYNSYMNAWLFMIYGFMPFWHYFSHLNETKGLHW